MKAFFSKNHDVSGKGTLSKKIGIPGYFKLLGVDLPFYFLSKTFTQSCINGVIVRASAFYYSKLMVQTSTGLNQKSLKDIIHSFAFGDQHKNNCEVKSRKHCPWKNTS